MSPDAGDQISRQTGVGLVGELAVSCGREFLRLDAPAMLLPLRSVAVDVMPIAKMPIAGMRSLAIEAPRCARDRATPRSQKNPANSEIPGKESPHRAVKPLGPGHEVGALGGARDPLACSRSGARDSLACSRSSDPPTT